MYFDYLEEREKNGSFYIVAVDKQSETAYIINNTAIIQTAASSDGFRLAISVYPDTYEYRGKLQSKKQMEDLSKNMSRLIVSADFKTNGIHRA